MSRATIQKNRPSGAGVPCSAHARPEFHAVSLANWRRFFFQDLGTGGSRASTGTPTHRVIPTLHLSPSLLKGYPPTTGMIRSFGPLRGPRGADLTMPVGGPSRTSDIAARRDEQHGRPGRQANLIWPPRPYILPRLTCALGDGPTRGHAGQSTRRGAGPRRGIARFSRARHNPMTWRSDLLSLVAARPNAGARFSILGGGRKIPCTLQRFTLSPLYRFGPTAAAARIFYRQRRPSEEFAQAYAAAGRRRQSSPIDRAPPPNSPDASTLAGSSKGQPHQTRQGEKPAEAPGDEASAERTLVAVGAMTPRCGGR